MLAVELNGIDLNYLKLQTDLLTTNNNTLISITNTLVQDINSNYNQPIPVSSPLIAGRFVADTVAPQLLSYTLDMNLLRLELTFDEPVLSVHSYPNAPTTETYKQSQSLSLNGLVTTLKSALTTLTLSNTYTI